LTITIESTKREEWSTAFSPAGTKTNSFRRVTTSKKKKKKEEEAKGKSKMRIMKKSCHLVSLFVLVIVWIVALKELHSPWCNVISLQSYTSSSSSSSSWETMTSTSSTIHSNSIRDINNNNNNSIELNHIKRETDETTAVQRLARAYTPWQQQQQGGDYGERYGWCIPKQERWDDMRGILFAKTFKTGSSTASAVTLQTARRVAQRKAQSIIAASRSLNNETTAADDYAFGCHVVAGHKMSVMNYIVRKTQPSILWTIVRHPTSRALSAYHFYHAGHGQQPATNENIISFVDSVKNQQLIQLRTLRDWTVQGGEAIRDEVQIKFNNLHASTRSEVVFETILAMEILPIYNFIAVMERMDESLVVFKLLFDLEHADIIVGSASKQSGGWDWDWDGPAYPNGTCFAIPKPNNLTNVVQEHLQTVFVQDNGDFMLHQVANRNLDLTIDMLGRDLVQQQVAQHRKLKKLVMDKCQDQVITPCDEHGNFQPEHRENCFQFDEGCGYQCINDVLDEFERNGILDTL
jgi:hypothetical protein